MVPINIREVSESAKKKKIASLFKQEHPSITELHSSRLLMKN